jgi:hypothetical protein
VIVGSPASDYVPITLNLSFNQIGNQGAQYLSDILRNNKVKKVVSTFVIYYFLLFIIDIDTLKSLRNEHEFERVYSEAMKLCDSNGIEHPKEIRKKRFLFV